MSDNRFREVVYLATVPESFEPDRCWTPPEAATDLRLYAKKLSYEQAAGFVSTHNTSRIDAHNGTGEPIGTWAIWSKWVKPRRLRFELRNRLRSGIQLSTPIDQLDLAGTRLFRICVGPRTLVRRIREADAREFLENFNRFERATGRTAEAFEIFRQPQMEGGAA